MTGATTPGRPTRTSVFALNTGCGLAWSDTLNGITADSPALANVQGNGQLDVVEGTQAGHDLRPQRRQRGHVVWSAPTSGAVIGSPVTADLTGGGYQDVIVPTTDGIDIFDGRSGAKVDLPRTPTRRSRTRPSLPTTPTATSALTGRRLHYASDQGGDGQHWEIDNTGGSGSSVNEAGAWPQFHHDPQLTGDAGTPGAHDRGPVQRSGRRT